MRLCPPAPTALPPNSTNTPPPWPSLGKRVSEWCVRGGGVEGPPEDSTCHVSTGTGDTEEEELGGEIEEKEAIEGARAGVRSMHHVSL